MHDDGAEVEGRSGGEAPPGLPVWGQAPVERRDAARSRRRILDAARARLASQGTEGLTMNAIAVEAGVGVGTVYRRFGSLPALLHSILDDEERALQDRLLRAEPPLQVDQPPDERLVAFLHAYLDHVEANLDLLYEADTATPGARFEHGAYADYRRYLATLVAAATPEVPPTYTADLLLAATDAELYATQRHRFGMRAEEIKASVAALVQAVLERGQGR